MRFFIELTGRLSSAAQGNLEKLNTPQITVVLDTADEIEFGITADNRAENTFVQWSFNEDFTESTTVNNVGNSFTLLASEINQPLQEVYFRVRSTANSFVSSNFVTFVSEQNLQTPIVISNFQGLGEDGQVELSWDSVSNATELLLYRNGVLYQTLANSATTYVDTDVTNNTTYSYYLIATPINFNFIAQATQTINLTPQSDAPTQLSTPTNIQASFTQTNGEVNLTWNTVLNANQYRILVDGVFDSNVATNSKSFTGLTVGQQYQVSIIAQDTNAVFADSDAGLVNFTVADVENEDFLTLEQFGGQAWYLPADGRLYDGVQYPTLTLTPYSANTNILNGTGLTGTNYTLVEAPIEFFLEDIVGKSFCGLFTHQNPILTNPVAKDEYFAGIVGSRYSTCVYRINAFQVIVDFEYNGGDRTTPSIASNVKGYFFFNNTNAFNSVFTNWQQANTPTTIKLADESRNGFLLTGYVVPEFNTVQVNINKDLRIEPLNRTSNAILKIGYEDYYYLEFKLGDSSSINFNQVIFQFSNGYSSTTYLYNIKLTGAHRHLTSIGDLGSIFNVFDGTRSGGISAIINGQNYWEHDAIENGVGITLEKFVLSKGNLKGGTYLTDVAIPDVEEFAIIASVNSYFTGGFCYGQIGGSNAGATLLHDINSTFDYEDQPFWIPTTQETEIRVTSNKSGLPTELQESYYPSQVLEIVSGNDNYFLTTILGSYRAWNTVVLKDPNSNKAFCFYISAQGVRPDNENSYWAYWDWCYRGSEPRQSWSWINQRGPNYSFSSTKQLVYGKIPTNGEIVHISRDYSRNETESQIFNQPAQFATVNEFRTNIIRSAICWTTVLAKFAKDFDQADRDLMFGKIPIELQPGDTFTIPNSTDPSKVYKVIRKEIGFVQESPGGTQYNREFQQSDIFDGWEFRVVGLNLQSFPFWKYVLDSDLPTETEITFDIQLVNSQASVLLNEQTTQAKIIYKDTNSTFGSNSNLLATTGFLENAEFTSSIFQSTGSLGHLAYNVGQLSHLAIGCDFRNSFYRMNTNSITINNLRRFTKGWHMINCINPPTGQWGGVGAAPGSTRTQFNSANDILDANLDYTPPVTSEGWPRGVYQSYIDMTPGISAIISPERNLLIGTSAEHEGNIPTIPNSFQALLTELGETINL
jgi:hypothetical protein